MPQFGNVPGDDSLGTAVKGRAQQARQLAHNTTEWGHPTFGPLPDPKWDGLFQALGEQGVDQVAGANLPGSRAFVGQKHLSGKNGAGEIGPQGFAPATGNLAGPMMGYGAPTDPLQGYGGGPDQSQIIRGRTQQHGTAPMNGLNSAYTPSYGRK